MSKEIRVPSGHPGGTSKFTECPDMFCPVCGNKGLWEDDMDDYYAGCGYWCLKCNSISSISSQDIQDQFWKARLEHLKKQVETNEGGK